MLVFWILAKTLAQHGSTMKQVLTWEYAHCLWKEDVFIWESGNEGKTWSHKRPNPLGGGMTSCQHSRQTEDPETALSSQLNHCYHSDLAHDHVDPFNQGACRFRCTNNGQRKKRKRCARPIAMKVDFDDPWGAGVLGCCFGGSLLLFANNYWHSHAISMWTTQQGIMLVGCSSSCFLLVWWSIQNRRSIKLLDVFEKARHWDGDLSQNLL